MAVWSARASYQQAHVPARGEEGPPTPEVSLGEEGVLVRVMVRGRGVCG